MNCCHAFSGVYSAYIASELKSTTYTIVEFLYKSKMTLLYLVKGVSAEVRAARMM